MRLQVNGEDHDVEVPLSVADLLARLDYETGAVAVAVNQEFVPRSAHASTLLGDGDTVECVAPQQGG